MVASIGRTEAMHFHDLARQSRKRRAVRSPTADPGALLPRPHRGHVRYSELFQTNLIMPEPCDFLRKDLPRCSVIRPTLDQNGGAMAAARFLTATRLFHGQSQAFFHTLTGLARAAEARRHANGGLALRGLHTNVPVLPPAPGARALSAEEAAAQQTLLAGTRPRPARVS